MFLCLSLLAGCTFSHYLPETNSKGGVQAVCLVRRAPDTSPHHLTFFAHLPLDHQLKPSISFVNTEHSRTKRIGLFHKSKLHDKNSKATSEYYCCPSPRATGSRPWKAEAIDLVSILLTGLNLESFALHHVGSNTAGP